MAYRYSWIDANLTLEKKLWLSQGHSRPLLNFHYFLKGVYYEVKRRGNVYLLWQRLPDKYQKETQDYNLYRMFKFLGKLIANELESHKEEMGWSTIAWIQKKTFNFLYEITENGIIPGDPSKVTDYEKLLKKYIRHVGICEGTVFITNPCFKQSNLFSKDEIAYLKSLIA